MKQNIMEDHNKIIGKSDKSLIKETYNYLLTQTEKPWAIWLLGLLSFTESCCFIIPPEIMLLPMTYADRKKAWKYAFVTSICSVLGAIAGYYIGLYFWDIFSPLAYKYIGGFEAYFQKVGDLFEENAVTSLLLAAFTPIPFKVFTVASGVYSAKISLGLLVSMSLIGRTTRYFILAGIVYVFGPKAHEIIEKHFKLATIIIAILGIGVILLKIKY